MHMMAATLRRIRQQQRTNTLRVLFKDRPNSGPLISPARNAAVPGVAIHEKSNRADSANGLAVTGGMRITSRCRPGTGGFQDVRSRTRATGGAPHNTTSALTIRNGDQARRYRPETELVDGLHHRRRGFSGVAPAFASDATPC